MKDQKTFLFLTQVFPPDPAAVGQHMADLAEELVRRGHRVIVYTADRGYDDPSALYPCREIVGGAEVRRVPFASTGKRSIPMRLLGGMLLTIQVVLRGLSGERIDAVVVSTSPPGGALGARLIAAIRRVPLKYWVMDVNPDQMVALGLLEQSSPPVRAFEAINRAVLRNAADVIVLDRFMAKRINEKLDVAARTVVLPPWPAADPREPVAHSANFFRAEHVPQGRRVVLYSGNHGPSNPLSTILRAAAELRDDPRLLFMFIGGGIGKREVDALGTANVISLPYQPLSALEYSLSAADVHLVTVGDAVPGIVHPSKIYAALAVGRPILYVGPAESHVTDIMNGRGIGWQVRHGDVDGALRALHEIAACPQALLDEMGERARRLSQETGGRSGACSRVADVVERGV